MTKRTFNITPPLREAIIELADAYATFKVISSHQKYIAPDHIKRLREAQDAFGIELHPRHILVALEQKQEQKEAA